MTEWFDGLSGIEQFLFTTGVGSTLIFTIQFLMTLLGITDDDADTDGGDGADDGYSFGDIFTIRNGVSFLMGLSWGGLMVYDWGLTHPLFVATGGSMVGSFFVAINMALLFGMSKLKHDGSIRLENAIDQRATVTLSIPASRQGIGKVRVSIQGRLKEYHALTDGDALGRNAVVKVLDVTGSQLVVAGAEE